MIQERLPEEQRDESSDEIAEEIRANRHRIDAQLEDLAARLKPERLVDATAHELAEMVSGDPVHLAARAFDKLRSAIQRHPVGSLLIAAGLAVCLLESSSRNQKTKAVAVRPTAPPPAPIPPPATPSYTAEPDLL